MKTQTQFENASIVSIVNGSIVVKSAAGIEHTFTNASVVSVNNGTIIIESEWVPKRGELVKITGNCIDVYCIINNESDCRINTFGWKRIHYNSHCLKNDFWLKGSKTRISPVTPEEQKEFDDFCKSQGKLWNKETLQWEKYRWKPKKGELYFSILLRNVIEIAHYSWDGGKLDTSFYEMGNCFKTKEKAEAKYKQIKKLLLEV